MFCLQNTVSPVSPPVVWERPWCRGSSALSPSPRSNWRRRREGLTPWPSSSSCVSAPSYSATWWNSCQQGTGNSGLHLIYIMRGLEENMHWQFQTDNVFDILIFQNFHEYLLLYMLNTNYVFSFTSSLL